MLTYEDCLGLCDLTEEEVAAIAEHEHIPMMAAAALGHYLVCSEDGEVKVKRMILEDIEKARAAGDFRHAAELKLALKHFVDTHPHARGKASQATG